MSFFAVGDDGLILSLVGATLRHARVGSYDSQGRYHFYNLNAVARTHVAGEDFEHVVCVSDTDGLYWFRSQQGWHRGTTGVRVNAIAFARGTLTGFAAGDDRFVLMTTNAKDWTTRFGGTGLRNLQAVCAADEHQVWVAGDEGEIHKSSDGGSCWSQVDTRVSKHLRGICCGSGLVIAVGDDGIVVFHKNGTWRHTQITGKHLRAVAMSPNGRVIAVGDDGWIGIRQPAASGSEADHWADHPHVTSKHLRGVTALDDYRWAIVGDSTFLTSDDGGIHWHQHATSSTLNAVC